MHKLITILVVVLTVIYAAFVGADIATGNSKDLLVDGIMLTFWLIFLCYILINAALEIRHLERHLDSHHDRMARDAMKDLNKILGDVLGADKAVTKKDGVTTAKAKAPVKPQQSKGTRKVAQNGNKKA